MMTQVARAVQLAAKGLQVGRIVASRRVHLDEAAFEVFSALTGDSHPIHSNRRYASAKGLPAPLAHGLLLTAMTAIGATTLSPQLEVSMVAMLGTTARFIAPVFLNETLKLDFRVGKISEKSMNRAVVTFEVELTRAEIHGERPLGELVALVTHTFMLLSDLEER